MINSRTHSHGAKSEKILKVESSDTESNDPCENGSANPIPMADVDVDDNESKEPIDK